MKNLFTLLFLLAAWSVTQAQVQVPKLTPANGAIVTTATQEVFITFDHTIQEGENFYHGVTFTPSAFRDGGAYIDDNKLIIRHTYFKGGHACKVTIEPNVIEGQTETIEWSFTTKSPEPIAYTPGNGATGVTNGDVISVLFDVGDMEIDLHENKSFYSEGITVTPYLWDLNPYFNDEKNGIIIDYYRFAANTTYTVNIAGDVLAGQPDPITWSFTTKAATLETVYPANGTVTSADAITYVQYDMFIEEGENIDNVTIEPDPGNYFAKAQSRALVIQHNDYQPGTTYTVTVPANAVKGIDQEITWSFTALETGFSSPEGGEIGVAVDAEVKVVFGNNITADSNIGAISITPDVADVSGSVNGNTLTVAHADFAKGTEYTVTIPAGAIDGVTTPIKWSFTTEAPKRINTSIAENATNIAVATEFYVEYDDNISRGSYFSEIKLTPDPGDVEVSIIGAKLNIAHTDFAEGTTYTIIIPADAIKGQKTADSWSFTTVAPAVTARTPAVDATDVDVKTSVTVEFDRPITAGTAIGNISFSPFVGNVSGIVNGKILTIAHADFSGGTKYTVTIPAGAIKGQNEEIKWTFTTSVVLGIDDMEKLEAKLYPNPVPAGMEYNIFTDDNSNAQRIVEIFNATGAIVQKTEASNSLIRLTAPKEQGIYLLRITSGNKTGVYRLVVINN